MRFIAQDLFGELSISMTIWLWKTEPTFAYAVYILPILLDKRSGHCPSICFWSRVSSRNSTFLLNLQSNPEIRNSQHNSLKLLLAYFLTLFERTTFGPWWKFLTIWNKMKEVKIFNFILKSGLIFYISFSLLKTQFLLSVTYQSLSLPTSYIWIMELMVQAISSSYEIMIQLLCFENNLFVGSVKAF